MRGIYFSNPSRSSRYFLVFPLNGFWKQGFLHFNDLVLPSSFSKPLDLGDAWAYISSSKELEVIYVVTSSFNPHNLVRKATLRLGLGGSLKPGLPNLDTLTGTPY